LSEEIVEFGVNQCPLLAVSRLNRFSYMKFTNVFVLNTSRSSVRGILEKISTPYNMVVAGAGLILAFLAFLPLLNGWFKISSESEYLGIWYTDYTETYSSELSCDQKGTTRLYGDNKYAYIGLIRCHGGNAVATVDTAYQFRAGGIWKVEDGHLVFEIKDSNSYTIKADVNGTPDAFLLSQNVSDVVTNHRPFSFKILEKNEGYFRATKDAPDGNDMIVEFHKKDKEFTVPVVSS